MSVLGQGRQPLFRVVFVVFTALSIACGAGGEDGDEGASTASITDISHTPVKRQSIGNCWLYATATWMESLRRSYTGEELNVSESYWTYWHWFEQIANGEATDTLATGGSWGDAAELILRYGYMSEGDFLPHEADAEMSLTQQAALDAINASLKSGALATEEARRDRALVRRELDAAWGLSPTVSSNLDAVFGADVGRTLDRSTVSLTDRNIRRARGLRVGYALDPVQGRRRYVSLEDALGKAASTWNPDVRVGTFAWSERTYPYSDSGRRSLQIRVQRAVHDGRPVILSWFVDFNALNTLGQFAARPATVGRQGGHMTVLEDYEIDDVPGFGTLPAGTLETRTDALSAALSPTAKVRFLRVKNSWGNYRADRNFVLPGYHDLFLEYLNGPIERCTRRAAEPAGLPEDDRPCEATTETTPLWSFVLPPGF